MSIEETCPLCGARISSTQEGRSVVLRCSSCDWEVATSALEDWKIGDARYQLWLTEPERPEPEALIAIARLCGRNALQVRQAILDGRPFVVATGYHDEVEPVRSALESLGVQFTVNVVGDT